LVEKSSISQPNNNVDPIDYFKGRLLSIAKNSP
jgi:hypothetical protein